MMLSIFSNYDRTSSSILRTVKKDSDLDNELEEMELCDVDECNHGMTLMGSEYQDTLKNLHNLIVKKDSLRIRLPMHWEMDLVFTEIVTKDNFGSFGESHYEIVLPYEIFMVDNIHFKGLVRFRNILNLPNKIRGMSLTNKLGLKESTQLISDTISAYTSWLIDQCFNTHEERKSNLKLFKSEYLFIHKTKLKTESKPKTMKSSPSKNHLTYVIDIAHTTVTLTVYDKQQKQYELIKFHLKRDFRIQKLQNQVDIEFSLKLAMFIELARKEMVRHL